MRLDLYLCANHGVESRSKACHIIELGKVKVNNIIVTKPSMDVEGKCVEMVSDLDFVSMGGYKLEKAIEAFNLSFEGQTLADIGASNGGFTDCLLRHGAAKVFAVDVGECALGDTLLKDSRVIVKDRLNARDMVLEDFGDELDGAVCDVSFISLKLVLPSIAKIVKSNGQIVALIKPQFEVGKTNLSKKGIVVDRKVRERAVLDMKYFAMSLGLEVKNITNAPERAGKNVEYLMYCVKSKPHLTEINVH